MIAALQMYDWPEVAARTDAFWQRVAAALAEEGIAAPATLARPDDLSSAWSDPTLLLGQSCGLPYVSGRCGAAVPVARPVYTAEGCGRGTYRSALICRAGEAAPLRAFRGRVAALNEYGSQSGCNALADAVLPSGERFFGRVIATGAHRASALAIAGGVADIAAIDAVAWALFAEIEPEAHRRLTVLGWTGETPTLPFITGPPGHAHLPTLCRALAAACRKGNATGLPVDVLPVTDREYDPIRDMALRVRGLRLADGEPPLGMR